jgi:hypothetical protein
VVALGLGLVIYRLMLPAGAPSPLTATTKPGLTGPVPPVTQVPTPVAQPGPGSSAQPSYQITSKSTDLNVRQAATTGSTVIATLKRGMTIQGTGPSVLGPGATAGWLPVTISLPGGVVSNGYVSMDFLTPVSAVQTASTTPQQPLGSYPLFRVNTIGSLPLPIYDKPDGVTQNGTMDNGTLVYGTGQTSGAFSQLLDPTSANLIAGWASTVSLLPQPAAVSV